MPPRLGLGSATSADPASTLFAPIDPLDLNPYLYFSGAAGVTTAGGAVASWSERPAGDNQLDRTLAQGTASLQPDNSGSLAVKFDGSDDKLAFDVAVAQAGIAITATSNGIFAYEVDADSIDEITALGFEQTHFQDLDLYAYVLLPVSVSDGEIGRVIKWLDANTGATKNPTGSLLNYWRNRSDLVAPKFDRVNWSGVTNLSLCWYNCPSQTSFPLIDTSNVTNLSSTWSSNTFTSFPELDTSSVTNFNSAWAYCNALTSFPIIDTSSGTDFSFSWYFNASLTSFPSLDLSSGTNFTSAWRGCTGLTSFPALDLSAGTNFSYAWRDCWNVGFTSFPVVTFSTDASDDINFTEAWRGCTRLTSFPALNLSRGTNFTNAWISNTALTSFGLCTFSTDAGDAVNFTAAWYACTGLTSFPAVNLSRGANFSQAWRGCTSLASFPALDLSSGTSFSLSWWDTRIVSFPELDLSAGTDFSYAFGYNSSMVSWGACNMNLGRTFYLAWNTNSALTTFPAGVFDDWNPASISTNCFLDTWTNCNVLTEQSIQNILLSISASGQWATSTGTSSGTPLAGKEITIGLSNGYINVDNLNPATRAACTALQSRGWEVVINGSLVNEYALSFNGTDEYVDTGYIIPAIATQTVSCWAKGTATGYQTLVSDFASSGANISARIQLGFYNKTIYVNMGDGSNSYYAYSANTYDATSTFFDGNWHHIVQTINAETQKFYIDGVLRHTHDTTDAATRSGGNGTNVAVLGTAGAYEVAIGRFGAYSGGYWDGEIDEVAIWDVALDADAVTAVYNAGQPINLNRDKGNYDNSDDIVSWWRMGDSDSGAGNFVTDIIATDGEALHLPGIAANYASVPDAADLDGFVNFTLEAKGVTMADWTPSTTQGLMSKYLTTGNERSWRFYLETDGTLKVVLSHDGTVNTTYISTAANVLAAGATADLMVMRNGEDIRFYVNGVQLGIDVTVVTTALNNSTEPVNIGMGYNTTTQPMLGSMQRARVWNSAVANQSTPTETPVLDVNFALANKGATSFTATSGQVVTVHSTAIANPAAIRAATDGVLVNTPTFVVDNPPNYSNYALSFDGTDDYLTMGDVSALNFDSTDPFTISCWVRPTDVTGFECLVGKTENGGLYQGYSIFLNGDDVDVYLTSNWGASQYIDIQYDSIITAAEWTHLAFTYDPDDTTGGVAADVVLYQDGVIKTPTVRQDGLGNNDMTTDIDFQIGARDGSNTEFAGKMDEVAIWNSALTSAQINDIYNGGVPAALAASPLGWWRMGENDSGAGTTISDEGSGGNDGTFVSVPDFSRSVPAEDATWNNRSLTFNGTNEYMTSTADDTLATKSYSFWAKSDEAGQNEVFDHGAYNMGSFALNWSVGKPLLNLGGSGYYRYWDDNSAQDDNAWHHWVVYIEHDDITACKLYCDGVLQNVDSTGTSAPASAYTSGIRIGISTNYFDGSLDEFAIFDGELTPSQVLQIYNGGKPASLKEFSPESWWRMGDLDDAGGTTITDLGVVSGTELVTNGEFLNNATGWTAANSATLSAVEYAGESRLRVANEASTNHGAAYQSVMVVVGGRYKVTADIAFSLGNATDVQFKLGTSQGGVEYFNSGSLVADTTITEYITATTTSLYIYCQNAGGVSKLAYFDNISVTKDDLVLNGGFDSDLSGWTADPSPALVTFERNTTSPISGAADCHLVGNASSHYSGIASTGISVTAGSTYELSISYRKIGGGTFSAKVGQDTNMTGAQIVGWTSDKALNSTSNTTETFYFTSTNDDTAYVLFYCLIDGEIYIDDVSLKQINGNPATLVNTPTFSTSTP